jgi:hypothetical protein
MIDLMKMAENLPTREDVLNAIGNIANRRSTASDMSSMLGAFGAGILIGAGLALLFAPKPGSELRQDIENRVSDLRQGFGQGERRQGSTPPASSYASGASAVG